MQVIDLQHIIHIKGYELHDTRIWSKKSKRYLRPSKGKNGYLKYSFFGTDKRLTVTEHRLLAEVFLPNPHHLPQVNHKNGDKGDNSLSNLEWCTPLENMRHAIDNGLYSYAHLSKYWQLGKKSEKMLAWYRRGEQGKTCTLDNCDKKHEAKGLCKMHYMRNLRAGVKSPHRLQTPPKTPPISAKTCLLNI